MKRKQINIGIFLCSLLLIAGLSILAYPHIENYLFNKENDKQLEAFVENMQYNSDTLTEEDKTKDEPNRNPNIDYDGLYRAMIAYNESLAKAQVISLDATNGFNLAKYGVSDGILGYIYIDKLNVTMPIRIGSDSSVINKGAGNLIGTSLTIGGINTNSVIVAHRGWGNKQLLRHIEKLEPGDIVTVNNLFEKIEYKVTESKIINKYSTEELKIQDGKDLLTLYTCHPYRVNSHRYIVYCERVKRF